MRVLSLFDGMSCGRVALERTAIPVTEYYASEIDKYAITVGQANWPDNIQIGDVRIVRQMCEAGLFGHIDMLIGGSPCQNLSFAGKQDGFSVEITDLDHYKRLVCEGFEFKGQSYLFWEYVWIRNILKPKWWLLENVRMKKEYLDVFNKIMGVEGVFIDSALVSAQTRRRYYWCNWPVSQPENRGLLLRDIIQTGDVDREKSYCIDANYYKGGSLKNYMEKSRRQVVLSPLQVGNVNPSTHTIPGRVYSTDAKSPTLTTVCRSNKVALRQSEVRLMVRETYMKQLPRGNNKGFERPVDKSPSMTSSFWESNNLVGVKNKSNTNRVGGHSSPPDTKQCWDNIYDSKITYRKLTPVECERLQGLPDNYTNHVSNTQRYKMLGNGWQVDTIVHILQALKQWGNL